MITGYFAAYDGTEFACAVLRSEHGVRLQLVSDSPVDGFTAADDSYTLNVSVELCDVVGLRRETATYGRHHVYVLGEDSSGVLVEYDGPNDPGEERARMVERGVWRQTVDPADLRNRAWVSTLFALGAARNRPSS